MFIFGVFQDSNKSILQNETSRKFSQDAIGSNSKTTIVKETSAEASHSSASAMSSRNIGTTIIKPSEFQKIILVWVKKYPNKNKIPERISLEVMSHALSRARIKFSNYMIAFSIVGFIGAAFLGKKEASHGINITDKQITILEALEKK